MTRRNDDATSRQKTTYYYRRPAVFSAPHNEKVKTDSADFPQLRVVACRVGAPNQVLEPLRAGQAHLLGPFRRLLLLRV